MSYWARRAALLALCLVLGAACAFAEQAERVPLGDDRDPTAVDASLVPDYWDPTVHEKGGAWTVDPRIQTNAADQPPGQLIKVTDRRHRHPVFATMCSIVFLVAIVLFIVVCTQS